MPAYIAKALTKLQHQPPSHPQYSSHKHNLIKYGVPFYQRIMHPYFQWPSANTYKKLGVYYYTTHGHGPHLGMCLKLHCYKANKLYNICP